MSVILDALQKARGDKKDNDSHKHSTAKVLEPTTSARPYVIREKSGGRTLLTIFLTAVIVLLIVAIGLVIFYLYNRLNMVEQQAKAATAPAGVVQEAPVQQAVAAVAPTPFPTPLPIQDLPVEPPAQAAPMPTAAMVTDAVPVSAPAADDAKKMFTLGSIVCENNDCLASINNQTVRVGDSVRGGYTVTDIHSSGLTLTGPDKQQITLSLFD